MKKIFMLLSILSLKATNEFKLNPKAPSFRPSIEEFKLLYRKRFFKLKTASSYLENIIKITTNSDELVEAARYLQVINLKKNSNKFPDSLDKYLC